MPHPEKEGYWKIFGRADDQIALSNGEKVRVDLFPERILHGSKLTL